MNHHELVRKMRPNDSRVLYNQQVFEDYLKEKKEKEAGSN
jgi:hypothetical protein